MILTVFTLLHIVVSLVGISSGLVVLLGLLTAKPLNAWTKLFLITTVLTSVTGFFFPFHGMTPALVVGVISLLLLALAVYGRYVRCLVGAWSGTYVITSMFALYLNVFVLIVQLFMNVPALKQLAPKQTEPPFAITQLIVLSIFLVLGFMAVRTFSCNQSSSETKSKI